MDKPHNKQEPQQMNKTKSLLTNVTSCQFQYIWATSLESQMVQSFWTSWKAN